MLLLSVLAVLLVTLGTGEYDWDAARIYNLIPIYGTIDIIVNDVNSLKLILNIFYNMLLFMPLGFFMKMCMPASKGAMREVILTGLLLSLCIEVTQFILPTGRWADVDDVILNTLGTFLGCFLWDKIDS